MGSPHSIGSPPPMGGPPPLGGPPLIGSPGMGGGPPMVGPQVGGPLGSLPAGGLPGAGGGVASGPPSPRSLSRAGSFAAAPGVAPQQVSTPGMSPMLPTVVRHTSSPRGSACIPAAAVTTVQANATGPAQLAPVTTAQRVASPGGSVNVAPGAATTVQAPMQAIYQVKAPSGSASIPMVPQNGCVVAQTGCSAATYVAPPRYVNALGGVSLAATQLMQPAASVTTYPSQAECQSPPQQASPVVSVRGAAARHVQAQPLPLVEPRTASQLPPRRLSGAADLVAAAPAVIQARVLGTSTVGVDGGGVLSEALATAPVPHQVAPASPIGRLGHSVGGAVASRPPAQARVLNATQSGYSAHVHLPSNGNHAYAGANVGRTLAADEAPSSGELLKQGQLVSERPVLKEDLFAHGYLREGLPERLPGPPQPIDPMEPIKPHYAMPAEPAFGPSTVTLGPLQAEPAAFAPTGDLGDYMAHHELEALRLHMQEDSTLDAGHYGAHGFEHTKVGYSDGNSYTMFAPLDVNGKMP